MTMLMIAGVAALVFGQANSGADMLAKHAAALSSAKSLSVTFTVRNFPSAAVEYKLVYSKPGMLRIDTPRGYLITDGETIWEYMADDNSYTEYPGGLEDVMDQVSKNEYLAWASFFIKDQFKGVRDAAVGKMISIKGNKVVEVNYTIDASKSLRGTLLIDLETGIARGAVIKAARSGDSVETVVSAKEIQLGNSPADASVFAFVPPEGAKKVEFSAKELAKWYDSIDEGLKVAKATNRMVFASFGAAW